MAEQSDSTGCACLNEVNDKLKETGHVLLTTMFGNPEVPLMTIMRRDTWKAETRSGKPKNFFPTFCPFCGVKYPEGAGVIRFDKAEPA